MKKFEYYRIVLFPLCFLCIAMLFSVSFADEMKDEAKVAEEFPVLTEPGIVLTFDDSGNLQSWAQRIPLFKKYGAKATFFLDKPDRLNDKQKEAMKELAEIGCEIACHGLRHRRGTELVEEKGIQAYLDEEIVPAVKALEDLDYPQRSFAYPESRRSPETDDALKPFFRHIRTGGAVCNGPIAGRDNVFMPVKDVRDRFLIFGTRFDHCDVPGVEKFVQGGLERAKEKNEIILFYGHGIVEKNAGTYQTNEDALEELLKRTKELGLKFYTMGEL